MTLAEIFQQSFATLPAGVEAIGTNPNFLLWEITSEVHGVLEVSLWKTGSVMVRQAHDPSDAYPSFAFMLTPEQMAWLGRLSLTVSQMTTD